MADNGKQKWTEAEKTLLLLRIIEQLQAAGARVDIKKVVFPERSDKAKKHAWDKIRNEIRALSPATPTSGSGDATPGSRKRSSGAAAVDEADDDDMEPATPTPSAKRQRKAGSATPRVKKEKAGAKADPEHEHEQDTLVDGEI